jgi:hypothetical protein
MGSGEVKMCKLDKEKRKKSGKTLENAGTASFTCGKCGCRAASKKALCKPKSTP